MKFIKLLLLVWMLIISKVVIAQTGSLKIQISDKFDTPIEGVVVKLTSKDSILRKSGKSDSHGHVHISGLIPAKNYKIIINKLGYKTISVEQVLVSSGKKYHLNFQLKKNRQEIEHIEIVARRNQANIDLASSTTGSALSLDITDSIPTKRSYQDYLQLVPGVRPSSSGNPSSKSGVNFTEFGGMLNESSDNIYLLDGINVTDNQTGGFGANINSEIIQEIRVITGGLPAEFEGGTGLVSQVITKSGANEFHGSLNYYFQNDNLMASHNYLAENDFSNFDTAFTLGGPIIEDKLWFFASIQEKQSKTKLTHPTTQSHLRAVSEKSTMSFLKLTWLPVEDSLLTFTFFDDPTESNGLSDSFVTNNRNIKNESGGDNYKVEYVQNWQNLTFSFMHTKHKSEHSTYASDKTPMNDIIFAPDDTPTPEQLFRGGAGFDSKNYRNREDTKFKLAYDLDTESYGYHSFKLGYQYTTNENNMFEQSHGSANYNSLSVQNSGITLADFLNSNWIGRVNISKADYSSIISAMSQSENTYKYIDLFDNNNNGLISINELENNLIFNSNQGNPDKQINLFRTYEAVSSPIKLKVTGKSLFIQDAIEWERLYLTLGIRAEQWQHKNSRGENIATFGWDYAPRFNISYDVFGDGTTKVWYFNGKYIDPIRTNMTFFVGNVSGPSFEDQVFVNDHWLTFRKRGGTSTASGAFSPHIKSPYTTEHLVGFSTLLSEDMSIELTYSHRKTKNLIEDYSPKLYSEELSGSDFYLPLSYFGLDNIDDKKFVVANLVGGERNYKGVDLVFTKHRTNNWNFSASYTYGDAEGNSNADGNVDFQGDLVWLDPRAPNMYGNLPGSITHLFKAYGTYFFANGIELGFAYHWNSGTKYNKSRLFANRYMPVQSADESFYGNTSSNWVAPNTVGSYSTPAYGVLDLRTKYKDTCGQLTCEFFIDIFNTLNNQAIVAEQSLATGDGNYQFGDATNWLQPRRLYLGARISF